MRHVLKKNVVRTRTVRLYKINKSYTREETLLSQRTCAWDPGGTPPATRQTDVSESWPDTRETGHGGACRTYGDAVRPPYPLFTTPLADKDEREKIKGRFFCQNERKPRF